MNANLTDPEFDEDELQTQTGGLSIAELPVFLLRFAWFHRKIVIGMIMLGAVGVWLYVQNLKSPNEEPPETARLATSIAPQAKMLLDSNDSDPQASTRPSNQLDELIQTGDKDELIEFTLDIESKWKTAETNQVIVMMTDRMRVLRQLLGMELTQSEQVFALIHYIETVSVLDSYNVQGKIGLKGTREALEEIDQKYSGFSHPVVAARANLAVMMAPGYEFVTHGGLEKLQAFRDGFDQRRDVMFQDLATVGQLGEVTLGILQCGKAPEETRVLAAYVYEQLKQITTPGIETVLHNYAIRLFFGRFNVEQVLGQIQGGDPEAERTVTDIFDALRQYPDASLEVFGLAGSCIRGFQRTKQLALAERFLEELKKVKQEMSDQDLKQQVTKLIVRLDDPAKAPLQ